MKGRKPIYDPENLEVGDKLPLNQKAGRFAYQYAYQFRKKFPDRDFVKVTEGKKVFIKRIA